MIRKKLIYALVLVLLIAAPVMGSKAIHSWDLSLDDIYDAYVSVVVDLNTLKDAIDDSLGGSSSDLTAIKDAVDDQAGSFGADISTFKDAIDDQAGSHSADLSTWKDAVDEHRAAVVTLADLTTELRANHDVMKIIVDEIKASFNAEGAIGNTISNSTAPAISNSAQSSTIANATGAITALSNAAGALTTLTNATGTLTSLTNATGTLGTTTP